MSFSLRALLPLLLVVSTAALHGQDDGSRLASYPPIYLNLIRDAMRAFAARDFEAAISLVDKADGIFQVSPVALNVRGAVAIEQRKFEEGRTFCDKALKLDANFFPSRFNLCEIPFVQGQYPEARAMFEKLLEAYPKNDLLKFRIFLTYLLEKNDTVAAEQLEKLPFLSDTPVYYYANASWAFAHGKQEEAKTWLSRGYDVFPPARHMNFIDVFYDLGWMPRPGEGKAE